MEIHENQCFGAWAGVRMLAKSISEGLCGLVRACARTLLESTLFRYTHIYIYIDGECPESGESKSWCPPAKKSRMQDLHPRSGGFKADPVGWISKDSHWISIRDAQTTPGHTNIHTDHPRSSEPRSPKIIPDRPRPPQLPPPGDSPPFCPLTPPALLEMSALRNERS